MQRLFTHQSIFNKEWEKLDLSNWDLRFLEKYLLQNPKSGKVIYKTNGIRKLNWIVKANDKKVDIKVFYLDIEKFEITFLLFVISKHNDSSLNQSMRKEVKNLVLHLKRLLKEKTRF